MQGLPTGTVTFLFTDLAGSTRLWEDFPDAMRPALARHDDILREAIAAHGGHVVKTTGDGFHAAFATAASAADAAATARCAAITEASEWQLPGGAALERHQEILGVVRARLDPSMLEAIRAGAASVSQEDLAVEIVAELDTLIAGPDTHEERFDASP